MPVTHQMFADIHKESGRKTSFLELFRRGVTEHTGIQLPPEKTAMLEQRVRRMMIDVGVNDLETFFKLLLTDEEASDELREVIDLVTTNTTSFYRERAHFEFIRNVAMPELLEARRRGEGRRLKFWSAACSEGAEAYTLAIVADEMMRQALTFDYAILGTDISTRILARAQRAIYTKDQLASIPPALHQRYVMMGTDEESRSLGRMAPELRRRCVFREMNLMDETYPVDKDVDVILLRNCLIYFSTDDQNRVIDNLTRHLRIGGYFIVGHAESMVVKNPVLQQVKPTIFKKIKESYVPG